MSYCGIDSKQKIKSMILQKRPSYSDQPNPRLASQGTRKGKSKTRVPARYVPKNNPCSPFISSINHHPRLQIPQHPLPPHSHLSLYSLQHRINNLSLQSINCDSSSDFLSIALANPSLSLVNHHNALSIIALIASICGSYSALMLLSASRAVSRVQERQGKGKEGGGGYAQPFGRCGFGDWAE